MKLNATEKLLQKIKDETRGGAPREDWVVKNREILLMQVSNTTDSKQQPKRLEQLHHFFDVFIPFESVLVTVRSVGVFLLVMSSILGSGLASVQLYRGALPGEMLYPVKTSVESVQLALSPNSEYRFTLHVEFADRRIDEVARLAEISVTTTEQPKLINQSLVAFENQVVALRDELNELQEKDPAGTLELAKMLERKMTTYQNLLQKVALELPIENRIVVGTTCNRIDDTAIAALSIIVSGYVEGNEGATQTVVMSKFEDRIKQAEKSLDTVIAEQEIFEEQSPAIQAKTAIAEAKLLLEKEDYRAALSKMVEVAELTKVAEESAVAVASEEAVTETVVNNDQVVSEDKDSDVEEGEVNIVSTNEPTESGSTESADQEVSDDAVGSGSR